MTCPFLDWLMPLMSAVGEHGMVWLVVCVCMLFSRRYRKWGVFALATMFVAWVLGDQILKPLIGRPRPFYVDPTLQLIVAPPSGYSMPSGHTLAAFCMATVLLFSPLPRSGKVTAATVAVLIAFSRLYLHVHNPSDVAMGAVFGIAFGLVGSELCRRWTLDLGAWWKSRPQRDVGEPLALMTTWGTGLVEDLAFPGRASTLVPLAEHPEPQFARAGFRVLNGQWDYALVGTDDAFNAWRDSDPPADFDGKILVPFSPETALSGAARGPRSDELLWYRRAFDSAGLPQGERYLLHFGAVDYACAVYVNGTKAALHVGGYLPFSVDVTEALVEGENELAVCVHDPGDSGSQVRGNQRDDARGRWRTAQSGIWQTVWIEAVPENRILSVEVDASLAGESLTVTPKVQEQGARFEAVLRDAAGRTVGRQSIVVSFDRVDNPALHMHVPHPHPWSPEDPCLYQLELSYGQDRVQSYCAFRTVEVRQDEQGVARFFLNGEPYFLRGVLDRGYWPDGLMTAPSDEALEFDVESTKRLGFNMARMSGKVECARWYWHCDRLGLLVWQDMPGGGDEPSAWETSTRPTLLRASWGRYDDTTVAHCAKLGAGDEVYRKEWRDQTLATVRQLKGHPCIATWSLFDEGRGQFGAVAAANMVRSADATRPIDAAGGWYDQACGDYLSVHPRFRELQVYPDRRGRDGEGAGLARLDSRDVPIGRAFVFSELRGPSLQVPGHSRYARPCAHDDVGDAAAWTLRAEGLLTEAERLESQGASGFVFAQFADVEGETDGIFSYDRRVCKFDGQRAASAAEDAGEGAGAGAAEDARGEFGEAEGAAEAEAAGAGAGTDADVESAGEEPADVDAEADGDAGAIGEEPADAEAADEVESGEAKAGKAESDQAEPAEAESDEAEPDGARRDAEQEASEEGSSR